MNVHTEKVSRLRITRTHTDTHIYTNTLNGTFCADSGCAASIMSSFHRFCDANNPRLRKSCAGSFPARIPPSPVLSCPSGAQLCLPNLATVSQPASRGSKSPLSLCTPRRRDETGERGRMSDWETERQRESVYERESGKERGMKCVCVCARGECVFLRVRATVGSAALVVRTYRTEMPLSIGSLKILRSDNAPHLQHRTLHLFFLCATLTLKAIPCHITTPPPNL